MVIEDYSPVELLLCRLQLLLKYHMMYKLYYVLFCSIMLTTVILYICRLADAQIVMENPPPVELPPQYRWLQDVYALDISSRLQQILAGVTSVYGQYLKLDSTKKVVYT